MCAKKLAWNLLMQDVCQKVGMEFANARCVPKVGFSKMKNFMQKPGQFTDFWIHQKIGSTKKLDPPKNWIHQKIGSTKKLDPPKNWIHQKIGSTKKLDPPKNWIHQKIGSTKKLDPPKKACFFFKND